MKVTAEMVPGKPESFTEEEDGLPFELRYSVSDVDKSFRNERVVRIQEFIDSWGAQDDDDDDEDEDANEAEEQEEKVPPKNSAPPPVTPRSGRSAATAASGATVGANATSAPAAANGKPTPKSGRKA